MAYKCVFSDIDGTLLNSKHQISEKTKKKVQQLAIQNIPFVLVSARMPKGMHYFLDELNIIIKFLLIFMLRIIGWLMK